MSLARNSFTKSLDLAEDHVRIRGPHERLGILVALLQVRELGVVQQSNSLVASAPDTSFGHFGE
jgi:hypothetical protein